MKAAAAQWVTAAIRWILPTVLDTSRLFKIAVNASWAVNWFLLGAKVYAVAVSSSKAVTAALVDSVVDLLSQGVLSMAERYISRHSPNYPVGRSRLEALSVIACAFIMSMASIEGRCAHVQRGVGEMGKLNGPHDCSHRFRIVCCRGVV